MDIVPPVNSSHVTTEEITHNNNKDEPDCMEKNEMFHFDLSEKECYDEVSNTAARNLESEFFDTLQEEHSSKEEQVESKSIIDIETGNKSVEINSNEIIDSIPKIECHSIEEFTVTQSNKIEKIDDALMSPENCASDNKTINAIADIAEEDEPIFDFLGKANEIVCYYFESFFCFKSYYSRCNCPSITNTHHLIIKTYSKLISTNVIFKHIFKAIIVVVLGNLVYWLN